MFFYVHTEWGVLGCFRWGSKFHWEGCSNCSFFFKKCKHQPYVNILLCILVNMLTCHVICTKGVMYAPSKKQHLVGLPQYPIRRNSVTSGHAFCLLQRLFRLLLRSKKLPQQIAWKMPSDGLLKVFFLHNNISSLTDWVKWHQVGRWLWVLKWEDCIRKRLLLHMQIFE